MTVALIPPYGGTLVNLLVPPEEAPALLAGARRLPAIRLTPRAVCDLELLAVGAFSPLAGFMGQADYARVVAEGRLAAGTLFPMPVTLPVAADAPVVLDTPVALCDPRGEVLAILTVDEIYPWDPAAYMDRVLGTRDAAHPLVAEMRAWGPRHIAGRLQVLRLPAHWEFAALRLTPAQVRARLAALGRGQVVAFQTRNPLHRIHEELTRRALDQTDGVLLLHPAVGMTRPGDVDHYTRVRTYQALAPYYPPGRLVLALLPLAMRMAGPREVGWHALIRRNYGATHLIVGRDHASPGRDFTGAPFYPPYAAQEWLAEHGAELGVQAVPFPELVYLPDEDRYVEATAAPPGARVWSISGTAVRDEYLAVGRPLPAWFTRPAVAAILAEAYPPRTRQGVCVWFTGLPGAGKSTLAEVVQARLLERGRRVTLLDGDVVRTHLSAGLGFSRADRDTHIRRVGWVAAEVVRHGGVAICAAISPYAATREEVRQMVGPDQFVEVYVSTPVPVCEARDPKGLYARARRGELPGFTGVDDPYEPPAAPQVVVDTSHSDPQDDGERIVAYLETAGFLAPLAAPGPVAPQEDT